jgi:hypothetical protein
MVGVAFGGAVFDLLHKFIVGIESLPFEFLDARNFAVSLQVIIFDAI